jgi:hypothetical protein
VILEGIVRFPWSGGRHPCLEALIQTKAALIGIESKRYEPFRPKSKSSLSLAYWRQVWGKDMEGYQTVRDGLRNGQIVFDRLDTNQLIKHAFGLRTAVHRNGTLSGKTPVLYYLYAEPSAWLDGKLIDEQDVKSHREEIARFANLVLTMKSHSSLRPTKSY